MTTPTRTQVILTLHLNQLIYRSLLNSCGCIKITYFHGVRL